MLRCVRRALSAAGIVLLLVTATACEDGTAPIPEEVLGRYTLVAVNGQPIPTELPENQGVRATITAGNLELRADGRFSQVLQSRTVTPDTAFVGLRRSTGSFEVSGTTIEFAEELGATYSGTVSGGRLEYALSGGGNTLRFTFSKQ